MKNKCNSFGECSTRSKVLLLHPRSITENGIFSLGQRLRSIFARITALVFCSVFCSKHISFKTYICTSKILMSKIKTGFFNHYISFSISSVNNLILKICDSDWKLEISILQFSSKVSRNLEAWKRPLESCPKFSSMVFSLLQKLEPVFICWYILLWFPNLLPKLINEF